MSDIRRDGGRGLWSRGMLPPMQRGQVEAPIELFVAVIILALSMALVTHVIGSSTEAQCIAELKSQVSLVRNAMTNLGTQGAGASTAVQFKIAACGQYDVKGVHFVYYKESRYCAQCPESFGGCWIIEPYYVTQDGRIMAVPGASQCVPKLSGSLGVFPTDTQTYTCDNSQNDQVFYAGKPCRPEDMEDGVCKGIPSSVWDQDKITGLSDLNPSRWTTFDPGSRGTFLLSMTKRLSLQAGREQGEIQVCVIDPTRTTTT